MAEAIAINALAALGLFASGWAAGGAWQRRISWRRRRGDVGRGTGFPRAPRAPQAIRREVPRG